MKDQDTDGGLEAASKRDGAGKRGEGEQIDEAKRRVIKKVAWTAPVILSINLPTGSLRRTR
ncbi:MAG: hypothetical protein H6881_05230 [Rhodobiaceae bacterium]|nr:hypothetical protein [Rhodobiaceae bacterium]MCC0018171.1 hypothetical protein [Rhodobiaceae bacterium]MCC0051263.1 hypothetical protein [Rhodobiaceae bacterium]MCC0053092.1 hypothetical protein [Rhodobiaceae bacterium]